MPSTGFARSRLRGARTSGWLAAASSPITFFPEIDRLVIKQNPAAIGSGIPMFDGPFEPTIFTPVGALLLDSGVRVVTLDRALT